MTETEMDIFIGAEVKAKLGINIADVYYYDSSKQYEDVYDFTSMPVAYGSCSNFILSNDSYHVYVFRYKMSGAYYVDAVATEKFRILKDMG